jgi:aspartate racemase
VTVYGGLSQPVVGILGGMGPSATADFMAKVVARTPVNSERDHLPLAVWSNPEIPDRTAAILGVGPSPVPAMADGVARLVTIGAQAIAVPCNTAHAFLNELQALTAAHFLNMIDATMATVVRDHPDAQRIGVLGTRGTRTAGLYTTACHRLGLDVVEPSDDEQAELVDRAIAQVKTGQGLFEAREHIRDATEALAHAGATVVIAGCTEIPLVSSYASDVLPIVDATDCLAEAVVAWRTT